MASKLICPTIRRLDSPCPCIYAHPISHGSQNDLFRALYYSQWSMEFMIGYLGEEIQQHSNLFANLMQHGLWRSQINALKAILPDFDSPDYFLPHEALNIGNHYAMLTATQIVPTAIWPCKAMVLQVYLAGIDPSINAAVHCKLKQWAEICLPMDRLYDYSRRKQISVRDQF